ncbi:hypothetical protein SNEBB_009781 [Seison nebaliae]|nr:hypothetical protein SNEBB_009781 [Seison nebaliae]
MDMLRRQFAPSTVPNPKEEPKYDPNFGFTNKRQEREFPVTEEEMSRYNVPPRQRDFCADKWIEVAKCRSEYRYRLLPCQHEIHQYHDCLYNEHKLNYFQLFNLTPKVEVDQKQLRTTYLKLIKLVHPDKSRKNEDVANRLTVGYNRLKTDVDRLLYLNELINGENNEESVIEQMNEEIFEFYERIDNLIEEKGKKEEWLSIKIELEDKFIKLKNEFRVKFENNDIEEMKRISFDIKYYQSQLSYFEKYSTKYFPIS